MQVATHSKAWIICGAFIFAFAGALSLVLTDLILVPIAPGVEKTFIDRLWFTKSPLLFLSCMFPPMVFAAFATHRWLFKDSKFFGGWFNVAIAAWLSLVVNPVIWFLVTVSYVLFGIVAIGIFFLTGSVMSILWRVKNTW